MTSEQKRLGATRALVFLAFVILAFGAVETYRFFYFKGGERVLGTVQDVDYFGTGRSSRLRVEIRVTIDGQTIEKRLRVPRGTRLHIGMGDASASVSGSGVKIGDAIDMLAVPKHNGYALAIADDVLHPGRTYLWLTICIAPVLFMLYMVRTKPGVIK